MLLLDVMKQQQIIYLMKLMMMTMMMVINYDLKSISTAAFESPDVQKNLRAAFHIYAGVSESHLIQTSDQRTVYVIHVTPGNGLLSDSSVPTCAAL